MTVIEQSRSTRGWRSPTWTIPTAAAPDAAPPWQNPAELGKDLVMRRKRVEEQQWLAEIEGIDLTLTLLRTRKLTPLTTTNPLLILNLLAIAAERLSS
ncbi:MULTISPECIES: hypothetical protein [unclassified Streptomyces]|uniref:hypothetical protein n=1 Tax=unclassified Streptomyces TaxID=2593676 RepID=UPI0036F0A512